MEARVQPYFYHSINHGPSYLTTSHIELNGSYNRYARERRQDGSSSSSSSSKSKPTLRHAHPWSRNVWAGLRVEALSRPALQKEE